jgi:HTH-type transcriptional regulator / antitoxin HipB
VAGGGTRVAVDFMLFEAYPQYMLSMASIASMPLMAYSVPMRPLWLQTPAQLSEHLRSLRKSKGLTQAELGALVGLDQTRIAKIEHDPSVVSVGQLMKLLAALQVRVLLQPQQGREAAPKSRDTRADW